MSRSSTKVAIQGFTGSYHALASVEWFGYEPNFIMCDSFPSLFKSMEKKEADCALMAIENSVAGSILPNFSLLRESNLSIVGEVYLRIEHCLLALPGQTIEEIEEVRSHPMALLQCRSFFKMHPNIKLKEDIDTAYIAQIIQEQNLKGVAAIAGAYAGEVFQMQVLAKSIEDNKNNYTRFWVLRDLHDYPEEAVQNPNKASLALLIANEPGSLSKLLQVFAKYQINLTHIQSSPLVGTAWEYYMHIDVEFDDMEDYKRSINEIMSYTLKFQTLGVYKRGEKKI